MFAVLSPQIVRVVVVVVCLSVFILMVLCSLCLRELVDLNLIISIRFPFDQSIVSENPMSHDFEKGD